MEWNRRENGKKKDINKNARQEKGIKEEGERVTNETETKNKKLCLCVHFLSPSIKQCVFYNIFVTSFALHVFSAYR